MPSRLLLLSCAAALLTAGEGPATAAPAAVPWSASFTTEVRGAQRQFVRIGERTFMQVRPEELADETFAGQEVALTGKLRRLPGERFGLHRAARVRLTAEDGLLADRLDGDNLHLAGAYAADGTLTVRAIAPAPSDAQVLAERQNGVGENDWDGRLAVVAWCREQGAASGAIDAWNATADGLLLRLIDDLGARAAERKDLALVTRALDLALGQARDQVLAARVASPAWIRQHGGAQAEAIAKRMRGLGFALYAEAWQPRAQALEREYEDRFAALNWKDAEGFYRLGRWVDDNAEALPRARERSWRCYQAGHAADPSHPGIARELGVAPAAAGQPAQPLATDLIDPNTGLRVPMPAGWRRAPGPSDAATWNDPGSETAFLQVRIIAEPGDGSVPWSVLSEEARNRPGYAPIGEDARDLDSRPVRVLRFVWTEGEAQRFTAVAIAQPAPNAPAVTFEARGLPGEQATLDAALDAAISGIAQGPRAEPAP